jgi:deazaflavin-dependent oxidoreductase (nitroreductase family)
MPLRWLVLVADYARRVSDDIGRELAAWGKVALVETRGRRSGRAVQAAVGYVEDRGSLLIAAGSPTADWAQNLVANPACRASIGERSTTYLAQLVDDPAERGAALTSLILKYGTPAERLGHGPVFRLVPAR